MFFIISVGKTSLASYLFPAANREKDIVGHLVVDDKPCEIELCHKTSWITSGHSSDQVAYSSEWQRDFLKKGDAFFIIIAMEQFIEVSAIQFYITEIKRVKGHDFPVFFVYNKSDLWSMRDNDQTEIETVLKIAESFNIPFINTVAIPGKGKNVERT